MSVILDKIRRRIRAGDLEGGRRDLVNLLRKNPDEIAAWGLLASLLDHPTRQRECYQQILRIDPGNREAAEKIQALSGSDPSPIKEGGRIKALLCPQCGGRMEVRLVGELRDKRAYCPSCSTIHDLPDSFRRMRKKRETDQKLTGSRVVETTTIESRLDGALLPGDPEKLPPEVQEILGVLKTKGVDALSMEQVEMLRSSEIKRSFSWHGFDADTIQTLQGLGFEIYEEPTPKQPSKKGLIERIFGTGKEVEQAPLSPEEIIELAGGALPEEQRRECPNPSCRAVVSKEAKKCPWCGRSLSPE